MLNCLTVLKTCLKPPPQSDEERRRKQQDAKWRRQDEAHRRQQAKIHADNKKWFFDNLESARIKLREDPGTLTRPMYYMLEQTRVIESQSEEDTKPSWKTLIPEYGEEGARFYKEGAVAFWRHYEPKLRSEGAPSDRRHCNVEIGLTGLEIEARENKNWTAHLSPARSGVCM